ncbi:hypothetical protein L1887_58567 [Cichorium endivia]|nr:hypothetical protein L1887_58567 [Cichorium endivia]
MCFVCPSVTLDPSKICKATRLEADQKRGEAERIPGRLAEDEKKSGPEARGREGEKGDRGCTRLQLARISGACRSHAAKRLGTRNHAGLRKGSNFQSTLPAHSGSRSIALFSLSAGCRWSSEVRQAHMRRRVEEGRSLSLRAERRMRRQTMGSRRVGTRSVRQRRLSQRKSDGTQHAPLSPARLHRSLHRRGFGWLHLQISAAETTHGV